MNDKSVAIFSLAAAASVGIWWVNTGAHRVAHYVLRTIVFHIGG